MSQIELQEKYRAYNNALFEVVAMDMQIKDIHDPLVTGNLQDEFLLRKNYLRHLRNEYQEQLESQAGIYPLVGLYQKPYLGRYYIVEYQPTDLDPRVIFSTAIDENELNIKSDEIPAPVFQFEDGGVNPILIIPFGKSVRIYRQNFTQRGLKQNTFVVEPLPIEIPLIEMVTTPAVLAR